MAVVLPDSRASHADEALDALLEQHRLKRKFVPRDGACLFRAVAEELYYTQTEHPRVRDECVSFLEAHPDVFAPFVDVNMPFDHYLFEMRKIGTWGGELELQALSERYGVCFTIFSSTGHITHVTPHHCVACVAVRPPILLAFSHGNHYDCVLPMDRLEIVSRCQSVVYSLAEAVVEQAEDVEERSVCEALTDTLAENLGGGRNVPLEVWERERWEQEDVDARLAEELHRCLEGPWTTVRSRRDHERLSGYYHKQRGGSPPPPRRNRSNGKGSSDPACEVVDPVTDASGKRGRGRKGRKMSLEQFLGEGGRREGDTSHDDEREALDQALRASLRTDNALKVSSVTASIESGLAEVVEGKRPFSLPRVSAWTKHRDWTAVFKGIDEDEKKEEEEDEKKEEEEEEDDGKKEEENDDDDDDDDEKKQEQEERKQEQEERKQEQEERKQEQEERKHEQEEKKKDTQPTDMLPEPQPEPEPETKEEVTPEAEPQIPSLAPVSRRKKGRKFKGEKMDVEVVHCQDWRRINDRRRHADTSPGIHVKGSPHPPTRLSEEEPCDEPTEIRLTEGTARPNPHGPGILPQPHLRGSFVPQQPSAYSGWISPILPPGFAPPQPYAIPMQMGMPPPFGPPFGPAPFHPPPLWMMPQGVSYVHPQWGPPVPVEAVLPLGPSVPEGTARDRGGGAGEM